MLSYSDAAAIAAAPVTAPVDPSLARLLEDRVQDWAATDLLGLTHLLIIEADDTEQDILNEVAFSPLVNPLNGSRFGSPNFIPPWDYHEAHDGWFELIFTVGNDGFAFAVYLEDAIGATPALQDLCRAYAEPAGATS